MPWSLRTAVAVLILAFAGLGAGAAFNHVGAPSGRLIVEECRLAAAPGGGLLADLFGGPPSLAIQTETFYRPAGPRRPLPAVIADAGLDAGGAAMHGFAAIEADGPAVDAYAARETLGAGDPRPLILRDFARDYDALARRYAETPGVAVARAVLSAERRDGVLRPVVAPAVKRPALTRIQRAYLASLPPREAPCRSRFLAEIVYGALGNPFVAALRPLQRVNP